MFTTASYYLFGGIVLSIIGLSLNFYDKSHEPSSGSGYFVLAWFVIFVWFGIWGVALTAFQLGAEWVFLVRPFLMVVPGLATLVLMRMKKWKIVGALLILSALLFIFAVENYGGAFGLSR